MLSSLSLAVLPSKQQTLYFRPLPHGHGSFLPVFMALTLWAQAISFQGVILLPSLSRPKITPLSPLKHRRYPWTSNSKEGNVTIAAGFVTSEGILLCSDSQYTGASSLKIPRYKL